MYEQRSCRICGKGFVATSAKQIFCGDECRRENKRRYNRLQNGVAHCVDRKSKSKKRKKEKVFSNRLEQDVYDLERLNIQRKSEGKRALSYGYYKSYKSMGLIK